MTAPKEPDVVVLPLAAKLSLPTALLIMAPAIAVRFLYWIEIRHTELYRVPLLDAGFYDQWAQSWAGLGTFDKPIHHQAALFPFLLSLLYRLFGRNIDLVVWIHFLLGSITAVSIGLLAARAFTRRVGQVTGVLAALYVPFFFNEATVMPTALNIFLQVSFMLVAQSWLRAPSFRAALFVGAVGGLAYLCRAEFIVLLMYLFIAFALTLRFARKPLGLGVAGVVLGALPFMITYGLYYKSETGRFRLLPSSDGINLYLGANPEAKGTAETPSTLSRNRDEIVVAAKRLAEKETGRKLEPDEVSQALRNLAFDFIVSQPGAYLRLLMKKIWFFVHGVESSDILPYEFMNEYSPTKRLTSLLFDFRVLGPFALLGVFLALTCWKRNSKILYIQIAAVLTIVLMVAVSTRNRLPAAPALLGFAGFSLVAIVQLLRRKETLFRGFSLLLITFFLFGLVNASSETLNVKHGQVWINIGHIRELEGNLEDAVEAYKKSIEEESRVWKVWSLLGQVYYELGDESQALNAYGRAVEIAPLAIDAWLNIGVIESERGNEEEAISAFERVCAADPEDASGPFYMAISYANQSRWKVALRWARRAAELDADDAQIDNQLAWILLKLPQRTDADLREAETLAERAVRATHRKDPNILDTLEQIYRESGKLEEAKLRTTQSSWTGGKTVADWAADLENARAEHRARAAWALGKMGPEAASALPALSKALNDASAKVRGRACLALGSLGSAAGALGHLAESGHVARDVVPLLVDRLGSSQEDRDVSLVLIGVLGAIGPDGGSEAAEALVALSDPGNTAGVLAAASLLSFELRAPKAIEVLCDALKSETEPFLRSLAAAHLANAKSSAAIIALSSALEDREPEVRVVAAFFPF